MRNRIFIFLSLFFLTADLSAQYIYKRDLPREANGDTSYWMSWADNFSKNLGIERMFYTDDSLHFRYWTNEQIVDVWMKDDGTMRGKIVDFAKTYEPYDFANSYQKPSLYYSDFTLLNDSVTAVVLKLFQSVQDVPTEDSISGWFQGMLGVSYELEDVNGKKYSMRHYWSPQFQDTNSAYVQTMINLVQDMETTLNLNQHYIDFQQTLPPGKYSTDNYMIMTIATKKQKRKAERYARHHKNVK